MKMKNSLFITGKHEEPCVICGCDTKSIHVSYETRICDQKCLDDMDRQYNEYLERCKVNEAHFKRRNENTIEYLNSELKSCLDKIERLYMEVEQIKKLKSEFEEFMWIYEED